MAVGRDGGVRGGRRGGVMVAAGVLVIDGGGGVGVSVGARGGVGVTLGVKSGASVGVMDAGVSSDACVGARAGVEGAPLFVVGAAGALAVGVCVGAAGDRSWEGDSRFDAPDESPGPLVAVSSA